MAAAENPTTETATETVTEDRERIDWTVLATFRSLVRCRRIFFGLLPVVVTYRVAVGEVTIDLIPDWVGWTIVATALPALAGVSSGISRLRVTAWALAGIALLGWVNFSAEGEGLALGIAGTALAILTTVFTIIFARDFSGLVVRAATDTQDTNFAGHASLCRRVVLGAFILVWLLPLPTAFGETLHPATAIAVAGLWLFAWVYFLAIVWAFGGLVQRVITAVERDRVRKAAPPVEDGSAP